MEVCKLQAFIWGGGGAAERLQRARAHWLVKASLPHEQTPILAAAIPLPQSAAPEASAPFHNHGGPCLFFFLFFLFLFSFFAVVGLSVVLEFNLACFFAGEAKRPARRQARARSRER